MPNINPDLFEPYEKLVNIQMEGKLYQVPENNSILRCLQFIGFDLKRAKLCWNAECENCLFSFKDDNNDVKAALACKQLSFEGMIITQLPDRIKVEI